MPRRYQKEIEEILQNVSNSTAGEGSDSGRPGRLRRLLGHWSYDATRGVWMLRPTGIFLWAVGFLLAAVVMQSVDSPSVLVSLLTWGGLLLILTSVILLLGRPGPRYEKRWRGRIVEKPEIWYRRLMGRFKFRDPSSGT